MSLQADREAALSPALTDLYWTPLANGLDSAPQSERELKPWLRRQFENNTAASFALMLLLQRFLRRGVNVGGVMGLELMGVGGHFYLTDPNYLAVLDGHAAQLTTLGRPVSLIDTTVNHLAVDIPAARGAGGNPIMALGDLIMGRVATRNGSIAITEETRATAWGQHWTYDENRVQRTQYWTRLDERVCFPAGTMIETSNGPIAIELIRAGMRVLTRKGYRCVFSAASRRYDGDMVQVEAGGHRVCATADHPFWTLEQGWLEGRNLNTGDTLQTFHDQLVRVNSLHHFSLSAITVYSLEVEEEPEFFANGLLVHNCEICRPYHGQIYRTDSIPRDASIPLHIRCRCYFLPVLVDWTRPPEIWRGH